MRKENNRKKFSYMMVGGFGGLLVGVIISNIVMGFAIGLFVGTLVDLLFYYKNRNSSS